MGFFARIANLWKGFMSLFVGGLEERHPEIAYENAINALTEKYAALKSSAGSLIAIRSRLEAEIQKAESELKTTQEELEAAIQLNNDEVALILIERQDQLTADLETAKVDMVGAVKDVDAVKESINELREEITKLKNERDKTLAKIKSAEARKQIQDQLDGLTVDDELKALEKVREYRDRIQGEVQVSDELAESSLEGQLKEVRDQSAKNRARARLEALKAKRSGGDAEAEPQAEAAVEGEAGDAGDAGGDAPTKSL